MIPIFTLRNLPSDYKVIAILNFSVSNTGKTEQASSGQFNTCSQNRQSTKFQNHENIYFVEKLYFSILYNWVYIAKHDVKSLHSGFIFRENTSHYKVGG